MTGSGRARGQRGSTRGAKQKPAERPARVDAKKRTHAPTTPEQAARAATEHETSGTVSPDKVKLTLTLYLSRQQAEHLTAKAIREGKNLEALVAEILEASPTG